MKMTKLNLELFINPTSREEMILVPVVVVRNIKNVAGGTNND